MGLVVRFLNRRPLAVCILILIGAGWGFWATHDFVVNGLQPRERAALQARIAAQIGEADSKLRRRQYNPALSTYRFMLSAHDAHLGSREKGRLQHQIGLCLMGLARNKDTQENLRRAGEAFAAAISLRPLDGDPQGYAESQIRLGQVHARLAQDTEDQDRFGQAIAAYREALKVRTAAADPAGYAGLQILIGNALRDAFVSGPGQKDERMAPALAAYAEALRAAAPGRHPETAGQVYLERAQAYLKLADGVFKRTHTRLAVADADLALELFPKRDHPREFGRAQKLLGDVYMKMYHEVTVDTGTAWQDSQTRYRWQESAKRAYELAAQFGVSRFSPAPNGLDK